MIYEIGNHAKSILVIIMEKNWYFINNVYAALGFISQKYTFLCLIIRGREFNGGGGELRCDGLDPVPIILFPFPSRPATRTSQVWISRKSPLMKPFLGLCNYFSGKKSTLNPPSFPPPPQPLPPPPPWSGELAKLNQPARRENSWRSAGDCTRKDLPFSLYTTARQTLPYGS